LDVAIVDHCRDGIVGIDGIVFVVDWLFHAVLTKVQLRTSFFLPSIADTLFGGEITFFTAPYSDPISIRPTPGSSNANCTYGMRNEGIE
jgi:hypothetical protein